MNTNQVNILLVDDHPLITAGIKSLIETEDQYLIIDEARDGEEAIACIKKQTPDVLILDIDMPKKNGVEVAEYAKLNHPKTKIIFLTSHTDLNTFSKAKDVSFDGFLFKENVLEEIMNCLAEVVADREYKSEAFSSFLQENNEKLALIEKNNELFTKLTTSEKKILKLIAKGMTTPEIAEQLFNSYKTIENHRYNICQKLEINGSNHLLAFALEHKDSVDNLQ